MTSSTTEGSKAARRRALATFAPRTAGGSARARRCACRGGAATRTMRRWALEMVTYHHFSTRVLVLACSSKNKLRKQWRCLMNHNYPKKRGTVLTRYGSHSGTFTAAVARRRRGVAAAMERAERRAQPKATTPAAAVAAAACGVSLVQQDSTAPCVLGKSFGCVNTTSIWAANCRGYFRCGIDGSEFACGFPPGEQSYECVCDLRVSQDRQPHEPAAVYRARTVQRAAAASPINDVHMTARHEAGGLRKVVRACQGARRKELVLICVNKLGVPSAKLCATRSSATAGRSRSFSRRTRRRAARRARRRACGRTSSAGTRTRSSRAGWRSCAPTTSPSSSATASTCCS